MARILSVLLAIASLVAAVPSRRSPKVLHEKRAMEPTDWVKSRRVDTDWVLPMRFGLVQSNIDKLEAMLMEVSHPTSPKFGQHYSPEEVADIFAPSKGSIDAVTDWLAASGIDRERIRLTRNKGWIHVNATTAEIENLLDAEYHVYTHVETGAEQIGMTSSAFINGLP